MRIAIIDDDAQARETIGFYLDDAGYEPVFVTGHFDSVESLVREVSASADGAVCDHRLQNGGLGAFYGAEVVSRLVESGFPAVLITQFLDIDADVSIRKFRKNIPYAISREMASGVSIKKLLDKTIGETSGADVDSIRTPHRAILRIAGIADEGGEEVVDAVIETWNPHRAIRFPKILMGSSADDARLGGMYLVTVNTGATDPNDLYLSDFELAPEPCEDDGL